MELAENKTKKSNGTKEIELEHLESQKTLKTLILENILIKFVAFFIWFRTENKSLKFLGFSKHQGFPVGRKLEDFPIYRKVSFFD
jgi:hypothetical protein